MCPLSILKGESLYEEASFKIYINKEPVAYVSVLVGLDQIYLNLGEYLKALEYPYQYDLEKRLFKTCYPDKLHCFSIEDGLIKGDSLKTQDKDIIEWEEEIYINANVLKKVSSFPFKVSMNTLAVYITAHKNTDIPLIKWSVLKNRYSKLESGTETSFKPDTLPLHNLRVNSLGYSVTSRAINYEGEKLYDLNAIGTLNGELLKGYFNVDYNYSGSNSNIPDSYLFSWSKANLNKKFIKQLTVFRSNSNMIMATPRYTNGILISNIPNAAVGYRSYMLKGTTTPNTSIEVYNNMQLVNFITSDSLGYYQAEIPVGGGDNNISTVTYDDYGNSYNQNQLFFLPPNLEPRHKFSYKLSSGFTDNNYFYYQLLGNYGITDRLTLSAGSEAVWNKNKFDGVAIISLKTYFLRFAPFEINYMPEVKWSINGSINPLKYINMYYNYQKFNKYQTKIYNNPLQLYSASLSGRIPTRRFENSLLLTVQSNKYADFALFNTNFTFNVKYKKFNFGINISSYSQQELRLDNFVYGLRKGYSFSNRLYSELFTEYSSMQKSLRFRSRTSYWKGNKMNAIMETLWDAQSKNYNITAGLSWSFTTADVRISTSKGTSFSSIDANIIGSAVFQKNDPVILSNRFTSGSHIQIIPFLDANGNEKYDKDEEIMTDIKIVARASGETIKTKKGINIMDIQPNRTFKVTIPRQALADISWQIAPKEFNIFLYPYQSHNLYIPIRIFSEISGQVLIKDKPQRLVNRLKVTITKLGENKILTSFTDDWGYYIVPNLTAGKYSIEISPESLNKKGLVIADQEQKIQIVEIPPSTEGNEFDGIDFQVR